MTAHSTAPWDSQTLCLHSLDLYFGIYLPENAETNMEELMGKAAQARLSSPVGRRYHFYDRGLWETTVLERDMADSMDHALQINEFVVYYQPKVSVLDQRIVGAEALAQWRHPQRGMLSPDMFLELAERYQKITHYVTGLLPLLCREEIDFEFLPSVKDAVNMSFKERNIQGFKLGVKKGIEYFFGLGSVLYYVSQSLSSINSNRSKSLGELLRSVSPTMIFRMAKAKRVCRKENRELLPKDLFKLKSFMCAGTDNRCYKADLEHMWGVTPMEHQSHKGSDNLFFFL